MERSSWSTICPRPERIFEELKEKAKLAKKAFTYDRSVDRLVVNLKPLSYAAQRLFGVLQDASESVTPPRGAYLAVLHTVPGLVACYHAILYEKHGIMKNEIMALEGPGGVGKTSLGYWLVRLLGGVLVDDGRELVETVMRLVEEGRWVPVFVIDDAAAIISKYWFMVGRERKWINFFKVIEYAKDWTGLILVLSRSFTGVARRVRELVTLRGRYSRAVARGYLIDYIVWWKSGNRNPSYVDVVWPGLRMDERDWLAHLETRRSRALTELRQLLEEMGAGSGGGGGVRATEEPGDSTDGSPGGGG